MKQHSYPLTALLILLVLGSLAGCGRPEQSAVISSMSVTQAYQTLEVRLTQTAQANNLLLTRAATPAQTDSSLPSPTLPSATPTQPTSPPPATAILLSPTPTLPCDRAAPGRPIDVTIDDNTPMEPGESFTKIWRLTNVGSCTWTRDYAAVWFSGATFGDTTSVPLSKNVAYGESIEISVDMAAPLAPNTYRSNWKLSNASGVLFGIGPDGDAPFWVQIVVVEPPTAAPSDTPFPTVTASVTATPTSTDTPTPTATASATATPPPTGTPTPTVTSSVTATSTPVIRASASLTLLPGDLLDLDSAQIVVDGGDLAYQTDASGNYLLTPQSGAVLGVFVGMGQPGLDDCQSASMSAAPIPVESLPPGVYLCYRTSQGLLGWARLNSFNSADFSISLDILTWAEP